MISGKAKPAVEPSVKSAVNVADAAINKACLRMDEQCLYLCQFLGEENVALVKAPSRKLERLTVGQLNELLTDVCDEIDRRLNRGDSEPFLAIRLEYSPKRNQARQKLADLARPRFIQLVSNVHSELERRFPDLGQNPKNAPEFAPGVAPEVAPEVGQPSESLASLPDLSYSSYNLPAADDMTAIQFGRLIEPSSTTESLTGALSATLTTPRKDSMDTLIARPSNDKITVEERIARGQTFNFDCLDNLIQDLNAMIGLEQNSEIELLKQRHVHEMNTLKNYTKHLEEHVIPAKNHEIAKHAAHIEELEGRLAVIKREHAGCPGKMSERDVLIEEQAALIKTIQTSYLQLQHQLASSSLVALKSQSQDNLSLAFTNTAGTFTAFWSSFAKVHESVLRIFDSDSSSKAERLTGLSEVCGQTKKLVCETEKLISRIDPDRMTWLVNDVEAMIAAKRQCVQALTFCIESCKDMGGKLNVERQVREAVSELARHYRALVDAAELVVSRAQVPSSPISCGKADSAKLPKERLESMMAAFRSLLNYVECSQYDLVELPEKMRINLSEAFSSCSDLQQFYRENHPEEQRSSELERNFALIGDAKRRLQLVLLNGAGILADQASKKEALNACRSLLLSLSELQSALVSE